MIENRTITIAQLKSIQILMTDAVRELDSSKEWVKGVDDLVKNVEQYVRSCDEN